MARKRRAPSLECAAAAESGTEAEAEAEAEDEHGDESGGEGKSQRKAVAANTINTTNTTTAPPVEAVLRPRAGAWGAGKEGCSGHIESIELVNFMCHRHLLVPLSPHINFIVGNNGSGKSAILTALTVCLGGRASATQRATSVDALIREGATSGRVRVRLSNRGDNPYLPDLYGEHLVVERSFRRGGANSYAVHAASGRILATRREDVSAICDHFGIQVDNPLAVLTQETAKRFLASARPKELYEFFMKATQLEQLAIDYSFASDKIAHSRARLEHSRAALQPLRDAVRRLEKQLADLERLKAAHQTVQQLRAQLTWALIEQKETDSERLVRTASAQQDRLVDLEQQLAECRAGVAKLEEQISAAESSLTSEAARLEPLVHERAGLATSLRTHDQSLAELALDARMINAEFVQLRAQLDDLGARIEAESSRGVGTRQDSVRARLAELDSELLAVNSRVVDARASEADTAGRASSADERLRAAQRALEEVSRLCENNQRSLHLMERARGDRLRAFGERMPDAVAEIRQSACARQPIGPVGMHLKLKDARWSLALEVIISANMEAFIVNDHRDRAILQKILTKHSLINPIVVLRFDGTIDISAGVPDRRLLTALDVLEIDNPVVRKMLVIVAEVERNVLIEDHHEAMHVIRNRPRNVNAVYTPTARINAGAKSVSVSQLHANTHRPKVLQETEAQLKELRRRAHDLDVQKKTASAQATQAVEEAQSIAHALEQAKTAIQELERRLRQIRGESRQIQDELREQETTSLSVFEQERLETEERMRAISAQFQANKDQQQEMHTTKERLLAATNRLDRRIEEIKQSQEHIIESISSTVRARRGLERDLARLERERVGGESELKAREEAASAAAAELAEMTAAATAICPRVRVQRTVQELDAELTAHEECLRNGGLDVDPVAVREDLVAKTAQCREAETSVVVNERLVRALKQALEQRQRAWEDFRKSVSKMSSTEFIFMLTARGFQGSLEYRHREGELHIRVVPQGQQDAMQRTQKGRRGDQPAEEPENRDVRQLSGGEKSYSTACFLFSLWQAMGSPLRCLDEFDVYMDPVNRNYILELLVGHARASRVQFVLITPNAIPDSYRSALDVRICRLNDPVRGQTTLPVALL